MNVPVVGLLSAVAAALGLYGLWWYHSLSEEKRAEADRLAVQFARALYNKALDQLTSGQLSQVYELVKNRMAA
jgi:hypothetical protein